MSKPHTPFVLMILDGFGYREAAEDNAITLAKTPHWDNLLKKHPLVLLEGSGQEVGLPSGQMGNSEVGHLHIGAGRLVSQDYTRINDVIVDGSFDKNPVFIDAMRRTKHNKGRLHILGLLSPGGVHSHQDHLFAAIALAAKCGLKNIAVHAFLDGRDTPPKSAEKSLMCLEQTLEKYSVGKIASITGRYYAMDRDNRWERTEKAYQLISGQHALYHTDTAVEGLIAAYERGETDEFVLPTSIGEAVSIQDNDTLLFMNFRADRARQLTRVFVDPHFTAFKREPVALTAFVSLTQYAEDLPTEIAYPPQVIKNGLGEYLSLQSYRQLRIAETEKYAHVTFFFNGGIETPFPLEKRCLIPSPQVATYDLKPEMSAPELTDALTKAILNKEYDVIICNYANADMVGHTGNLEAAIKAVETLDTCLGRVVEALQKVHGELLVTADHGNVEQMRDHHTGQAHTAHTCEQVPLLYVGREAKARQSKGTLCDIAPTLLALLELAIPPEMTGTPLFTIDKVP
ncbi:MAG: 2,3-bisphosphoglycerate-independent phosphoglycerate mutase [Gammaproteobacteria bacterium]|jgi:2,3-bisphosphoglycerate-independent phosphoglycerate mutase|nr:2,3-bisphosphoglycerate-independent phosphoglycerate mutase [Gammaproteobacteria bacterium]